MAEEPKKGDSQMMVPPAPTDNEKPSVGEKKTAISDKKSNCEKAGAAVEKKSIIKKQGKKKAKRTKPKPREKMKEGQELRSDKFHWKVSKLLGSGGFGDVYKVAKVGNEDKREYAMKTEMVEGDRRLLRLKIEVTVLQSCHEVTDPEKKRHFVEFVDRGITDKFKFLVMGLVGPSLEDIRRAYLLNNYSKSTAMNASLQTLKALWDLHNVGWLHRDIKPQNYAVGLGDKEDFIYILDFGIARKIFRGDTKEVKRPRSKVKFLGTLRFAARACHHCVEQGRKDDLETWLFMAFDLLDDENGLPWKRAADKKAIINYKEKFFKHEFPKAYKIVPKEFKKIVDYLNSLMYADEPDYKFIEDVMRTICKVHSIKLDKKPDWMGKLKKKPHMSDESEETSSDNKQSGSDEESTGRDVGSKKKAPSKLSKEKVSSAKGKGSARSKRKPTTKKAKKN